MSLCCKWLSGPNLGTEQDSVYINLPLPRLFSPLPQDLQLSEIRNPLTSMASFSIIPYLGPPTKPPRSFNKSKVTVEKEQGGSPLQDTYQVCPGENPNRSQLVCSFRSSMESTEPSEWGAAQHATENESVIRLTQSSPSSRDQCLLRVEDSAQLNHKDDLDYSDWVCSSRSSTISTELSESGKTQQADQSETCPLSQVSENPQQRQFAVASAKTKQQRKRKASIADLILDGKGDQGKDLKPLLLSR